MTQFSYKTTEFDIDLRDYFAARAMAAIIGKATDTPRSDEDRAALAESAYAIAGAMLAERAES